MRLFREPAQAPNGKGSGSGQYRRFAAEAQAVKRFLDEPGTAELRFHVIGRVPHAAAYNRALRQIGRDDTEETRRMKAALDVTCFDLVLDGQHVTHALRGHGHLEAERMRGQRHLENADFARVPRTLCEPDSIEPGSTGRHGGPAARVTKVIGRERYEVIVEVRRKRRQLAFVTMFKRLTKEGRS